ncbi:MAG TPA: Gfo/Idh/MocA family oxidoreductase [Bryobacteraceae bacterium]|jgi:predicted dehydrogenase|nr:Gfo/Idh/MocA family oxidoreductase [Bryobacteraceae bacterium]
MSQTDLEKPARRTFLKAGGAAAASLMTAASAKRVLGANDRVRIAVIGVRGRGWDHVKGYHTIPGVEIAAFCDIDENNVLEPRLRDAEAMGIAKPKSYIDVRKLLEDKEIDAVSIATPNHWHSLMGIWAAQAGKDIYIEKPCSHNWWEGRQLVRAVNKYKVICEHGSQCRSSAAIREAMDKMNSGLIGNVYMSRGLCYKWRASIGHAPQEPVPPGVHYDLWTGPAPLKPFTKNRFHYNWHWIWDTGNGDLGNQGIHEIDLARWGLGVTLPTKVTALGGHFLFDDDQQTPNVLTVAYEFKTPDAKTKMMNFEVRGWMTNHEAGIGTKEFMSGGVPAAGLAKSESAAPSKKQSLGPASGKPSTIGNLYYGSNGYVAISDYNAYKSFLGAEQQPGPEKHEPVKNEHFVNFIECVRSRRAEDLHAPILEGHLSSTLVHLANASYRLGRTINFDPQAESVVGDSEATELLKGTYRAPFIVPENV